MGFFADAGILGLRQPRESQANTNGGCDYLEKGEVERSRGKILRRGQVEKEAKLRQVPSEFTTEKMTLSSRERGDWKNVLEQRGLQRGGSLTATQLAWGPKRYD